MLILINISILDTELDLIHMDFFSYHWGGTGRNVIIFAVNRSSPTEMDNRKVDILILGKDPIQGIEHTLTAEKCVQLILLKIIKTSVWASIIMEQRVIYLLMEQKFINLKRKILKL